MAYPAYTDFDSALGNSMFDHARTGGRTPFMFTSLQRLLHAREDDYMLYSSISSVAPRIARVKRGIEQNETLRNNLEKDGLGLKPGTSAVISMMVNPNSIKWTQSKRIVKKDTLGGSVYFHFSDKNGRNNDILTLNFSGTTGYIREEENDAGSKKLQIWHDLYSLSMEPMYLPGNIKNEFYISYSTILMPSMLLTGFFSQPLQFSESADKPFMRDYSFGFTVTDSEPSLDGILEQIVGA